MNKFMIKLINNYQMNKRPSGVKKCRFLPTCSEYAKICYERFNFVKASFLVSKRLIKCNPFHKMAIDPVPDERKYKHKFKTLEETIDNIRLEEILNDKA